MPIDPLILKTRKELQKRGETAYQKAKQEILNQKIANPQVREAIKYFMEKLWRNTQHPAMLSLACEAVGGETASTTLVGASLVLLTGAADVHDDVIDQSKVKAGKKTLLGKYGRDLTILVGDALLMEGMTLLNAATAKMPVEKRERIFNAVRDGFFELGSAEALETFLRRNWNVTADEYMGLLRLKAGVAEMTFRLGAMLGDADVDVIEGLAFFGRSLGVLLSIRNEFVDTYELSELRNRIANECLPLPVLYAFRNPVLKKKLVSVLGKKRLSDDDVHAVVEMIMDTEEAEELRNELSLIAEKGKSYLLVVKKSRVYGILTDMFNASLKEL